MSGYYEDGTTQVASGPNGMGGMQQPMPPGYGYGMNRFGFQARPRFPSETKPFYLTSEFLISLVASVLIAITAASSTSFGAWRASILIAAIVIAYTLSRGLAKSGTRSHVPDPRDRVDPSWGRHDERTDRPHQPAPPRFEGNSVQ